MSIGEAIPCAFTMLPQGGGGGGKEQRAALTRVPQRWSLDHPRQELQWLSAMHSARVEQNAQTRSLLERVRVFPTGGWGL